MWTNTPKVKWHMLGAPVLKWVSRALVRREERPAAAGASVVVTALTETAKELVPPTMTSWEPGLNPYQPNHRIITPSTNSEELWPAKSLACTCIITGHTQNNYINRVLLQYTGQSSCLLMVAPCDDRTKGSQLRHSQ